MLARASAPTTARGRGARPRATARRRAERPIEHRMLMTATLCLLAFGAVMVYSASSARNLLAGQGDGTQYFVKYLGAAALGLIAMQIVQRISPERLRKLTPLLLGGVFVLLAAVLVVGSDVNGAKRWLGPAALQVQPSELMKFALVLYAAAVLAARPKRLRTLRGVVLPLLPVTGMACLLVVLEPDLGTAMVMAAVVLAMIVAAGAPMRYLGMAVLVVAGLIGLLAVAEPYRLARLTSFIDPWAAGSSGIQAVQGQIALGSGGLFGVGIGQSVQKIFYLPEAHTDFILAVIGEELGVAGIFGVLALYGMIAWAGLRTARRALTPYAKLLAAGMTVLILCQATLNIFVVLGLAPLTGVPLPFISYGPANLIVLLCGVGLLLRVSQDGAAHVRAVPESSRRNRREREQDRNRGGRDGGSRRSGAGGGRRAAS